MSCKLGCSQERRFQTEEELELHLFSLHGASMDDHPENNDAMKFCLLCKGFVNAYRLSLEDHTFFRCTGRHPWVREQTFGLFQLAKVRNHNVGKREMLSLSLTLFFQKFRESNVFTRRRYDFTKKRNLWENFSFFHYTAQCHSGEKREILSHWNFFSWNQLFCNFFSLRLVKTLLSRNFCQKSVREN